MAQEHLQVGFNSGDDYPPQSLLALGKSVIRKIIAEGGANVTPVRVEVSIF
jgi:hypothetical protein